MGLFPEKSRRVTDRLSVIALCLHLWIFEPEKPLKRPWLRDEIANQPVNSRPPGIGLGNGEPLEHPFLPRQIESNPLIWLVPDPVHRGALISHRQSHAWRIRAPTQSSWPIAYRPSSGRKRGLRPMCLVKKAAFFTISLSVSLPSGYPA